MSMTENQKDAFSSLRKILVPFLEENIDYSSVTVDLSDPRCNQPLIDLMKAGLAGHNFYNIAWNPPYNHSVPNSIPHLLARVEVADKLVRINDRLKSAGLELFILDAYRPLEVQNYFYEEWMPDFLGHQNPEKGRAWAIAETAKYWAPGSKDESIVERYPPPHTTGGAIDLTLRPINGFPLEMGTIFDDLCNRSRPDFFEQNPTTSFTDLEAKLNRRILFHAMTEEGFAPHPLEWWHFSYGDRIWSATTGQKSFYGYLKYDGSRETILIKSHKGYERHPTL